MGNRQITRGEIFLLPREQVKNKMFADCLFIAMEQKSFGAQGYVQSLGENGKPGGQAWYRASWEELEETGGVISIKEEEELDI